MTENREKAIKRTKNLAYWFMGEMLKEEERGEKENLQGLPDQQTAPRSRKRRRYGPALSPGIPRTGDHRGSLRGTCRRDLQ